MDSKKQDVKNTILPHTQAKLDLYKEYLQNYLRVLCNADFCPQINLYDIFCGAGVYDDGRKGSPLIALDCISAINSNKKITLTVNDNDPLRIAKVKASASSYTIPNCDVSYFNEDANKMLELVAAETAQYNSSFRNLVFIDPYGYSSIDKDNIAALIKNQCTEVILFLPIMQMYRFTTAAISDDENKVQYEKLRHFVRSFSNHATITTADTVFEYIHAIKQALSMNNQFYTCSHYIEREKGNYYAIFFIGSNIYGLEKMVEAKWKLDPGQGSGFKQDSTLPSLFGDEFSLSDKMLHISYLETVLLDAIKHHNGQTNCEIYKLALENEFSPTHAKTALDNLIKQKRISCDVNKSSFGISYRNYRDNQIVARFTSL